jgi:predicted DNA-binding protein
LARDDLRACRLGRDLEFLSSVRPPPPVLRGDAAVPEDLFRAGALGVREVERVRRAMLQPIAQPAAPENPQTDRPRQAAAEKRNGTAMTDHTVTVAMPEDLRDRLEALAGREDKTVEDCLIQAVTEYVETWEDYYRTVESLESGEDDDRPHLRAVND